MVLSHGALYHFGPQFDICSETVHFNHWFGHNLCSDINYLIKNTSTQIYFITVRENQPLTTFFFSIHMVLSHGGF